jgi:hypothetical protein
MRWLFSSFAVKVQVSDDYVTTGDYTYSDDIMTYPLSLF